MSVMSRHKDRGDGEEVVGKFGVVGVCVVLRTVNHEFRACLIKEEFHELGSEATESVLVHDHNLFDQAFEDSFQYGHKSPAFEVDAATDVGNELVFWVESLELLFLVFEAALLMSRGDPGVSDSLSFLFRFGLGPEDFAKVGDVV